MNHFKKIILLFILFTACWQPPVKPARVQKILGLVEAQIVLNGEATARLLPRKVQTQNALPDNSITFERKFVSSFEDETTKTRYLSATFLVNNATDQDFSNLTFYAYNQNANNLGGTAIKAMVNFGGELLTDPAIAQGIKPVHEMKRQGLAVVVNPEAAHFQGAISSEISNLEQSAKTALQINEPDRLLEYGFVAHNPNGTRPIAKRSSGLLTIAIKFPSTNKDQNPYKFSMTFVLADDNITRVTRSPEESTTQAQQRALALSASELLLIGGDEDSTESPTSLRTNNLMISTAPNYLLENTFTVNRVEPAVVKNDQDNVVTIFGSELNDTTTYFIESKQLSVLERNSGSAKVLIPAGLAPTNYGIIAKQTNGLRATKYPALLVQAGAAPSAIDPQVNARVFVEGYVFDQATGQPLENATVGIPGLEAQTDPTGYFWIRGIPLGKHLLKISHPEYIENYRTIDIANTDAQTIAVKPIALTSHSHNATIIGRNGGVLYATPNNSLGAHFIVPPDALEQNVAISMTPLTQQSIPDLEPDQAFLGIAHFEPSGLVFKKPALFNTPLPETNPLPVGASIEVIVYDHNAGKWITEPQNGKIIEIQGQKFAQLEILHFTHNGGSSSSPLLEPIRRGNPYSGCVRYQDGVNTIAAELIATNQGYTDESGNISFNSWSTSPSLFTLNPKSDLALRIPNSNNFECIILPKPQTGRLNPIQPLTTDPCDPTPIPINKGATARNTTNTKQLLLSSQTQSLYTQLLEFSKTNIDPSSLTITVNNQDVTKRVDFTQVGSTVLLEYKLLTNLPAKANAEFVIRAKSRGTMSEPSVDLEAKMVADVVAKVQAPNVIPIIIPDDIPLTQATPYTVEGSRGLLVVARATDAVNGYINTLVPVKALDNTGQVLGSFSSDNAISFRASVSNGSAKFIDGVALVPTKIKLDNGGNSTSIGHVFMSSSSSSGSSSRVQAVPDSNADCGDAPVGTVPVALDAPKTVFDTIANLPLVGGLLDWVNTNKSFEFDIAGIRFTAGDFVTLGWSVIPLLGDATVLADNFYNYLIGKGADVVEATLAGASLAFDATGNVVAGTAGSAMLFVFKVSKGGRSIFRDWMADVIRACTAKPSACYKELSDTFTYLVELLARGGATAIRNAEEQIARIAVSLPRGLADVRQALSRLATYPALDALGNPITIERLLGVMDDVDDVPGFDRVVNKISTAGTEGNIRGAFGELERAKGLRRLGATDVEFKGEVQFLDANGVTVKRDIDISYQDAQGNLIFEEVKAGNITSLYFDPINADGRKNISRAQSLVEAARKNGAIPRWNVPDCSTISSSALNFLMVTGIEVYDANLGKC